MAFLFKSKPKGAQEVVKNLKENLAAFDKKDIKEKDLKKVRVQTRPRCCLTGRRCRRRRRSRRTSPR